MLIPWLNKPFLLPLQPRFPRLCSTWYRDTSALESFSHTLLKVNNNNSDWSHQIFALHLCHRELVEHLLFPLPLLPLSLFAKMFAKSSEFQRRALLFPFPFLPHFLRFVGACPKPSMTKICHRVPFSSFDGEVSVSTRLPLPPSATSLHLKLQGNP